MSVLFARAVVVPVWMILFALIALLAPPFGATTGLLQLLGLALAVSALLAFMVSAVLGPVPHTYTPQGTAVAVLPSIDVDSWIAVVMRRVLGIVVSAGARFGMSGAFRRRSNDERAQHRTFARWCRPISATGHPGRHRAGWAYETAYEGALEGGPRCCEFMTRPS